MKEPKEPLIEFQPKLPKLSNSEKKVLQLLIQAGRLIAPIYSRQENGRYAGANFYPHGVSKDEIEQAAKKNPEILSPYTIVEKKKGNLIAVPYHIKYAKLLQPIADKLLQAAELTDNNEFAKGLRLQAKALLNGSYEEAGIYWKNMKPFIIDMVIGPVKKYDDKLLYTKTAYQAWVGILDKQESSIMNQQKEAILSARRKAMIPTQKIDFYNKVRVKVEDLVLFSGLMARTRFVGVFIPHSIELLEKYGADITLFKQINDYRVQNELIPTFDKFFSPPFKKSFTKDNLKRGSLDLVFFHELAHTYLTYRSSEKNLQTLYPVISELSSSIMGVKVSGVLLLKDMITMKQLESIMVCFIVRSLYFIEKESHDPFLPHYVIGGTIFINYLLETGAIKISEGHVIPNFIKIFVSINELATILEKILSSGTKKDAEIFINKYSKPPKLS